MKMRVLASGATEIEATPEELAAFLVQQAKLMTSLDKEEFAESVLKDIAEYGVVSE